MNLDQVQIALAVVITILSIYSVVSSVRRDLNETGRLRFRWVYLNILGLVFLSISNAITNPGAHRTLHAFLTIIGCLGVLAAVIDLSKKENAP